MLIENVETEADSPVFESVDEFTHELGEAGFELDYVQLSKGHFAATFPMQPHSHSTFLTETHTVRVSLNGCMDAETWMATGCEGVSLNGKESRLDELVLYPPGSELSGLTHGPCSVPQVCLHKQFVDKYIEANCMEPLVRKGGGPLRVPVSPDYTTWLDASVRKLTGLKSPDTDFGQSVEYSILGHLTSLDGSHDVTSRCKGRPVEYYAQTFHNALEYIDANLNSRLELEDLCLATKISLRTLQRVFVKRTGMSPRKYILVCKLNAIRRELQVACHLEETVSAVALKYHLNHLGRFSAAYHALFEEYPSETLMQR